MSPKVKFAQFLLMNLGRYDTETECDALEQEKSALELRLASQEQRCILISNYHC